ncbi:hypothetical protein [Streptomyces cyaneofuscatus]|uniref:hypothetical protein n=1 Tax=Streptomyces cyaneofuscatus TaxID=66883 RepID=UPI00342C8BC4
MSTDTPKSGDSDAEIRAQVRREVTGLTYERLGSLIAAEENEPERSGHRAAVRMMELRRILNLVSQQPFAYADGYTPAGDPEERRQDHPASGGVRPPEQRGLYEILARCTDPEHPGASEITTMAAADSVEEAVAKVRRTKRGSLYGPEGLYRVVEVFEDTPSTSARRMEQARAQAAAEIGLAAAAAAGSYEPAPEADGPLDILADFFHRTVIHPWHLAHPGDPGDGSTPPYPSGTDYGRNLARLLLAHLHALDMPLGGATVHCGSTLPPHDAVAYGQELARIGHHQSVATAVRRSVFQALAGAGLSHEEADDTVSKIEAGAVAGAHTWISESIAPHLSAPCFADGWHAGVRDVASELLVIADTTATAYQGRAAAMRFPGPQQPDPPAPQEAPPEPVPMLDPVAVLAAAERFPYAVAAPDKRHWPDGADFLNIALSAVRPEERAGYIEHLKAFVEQHRARLEKVLRAYGPGSEPASHGRYALIGQPETLVILERMETAPFLLRSQWEQELETVFLDDLEFVWGPRIRLNR